MQLLKKLKPSFYIPGTEMDPVKDAVKRVVGRRVPLFPRTVQIETQAGCNASCVFCPISDVTAKVPKGKMPQALFEKIVQEIGRIGATQRISPYLTNEPFLDSRIVERSRYIKRVVPHCEVAITTNAGMLKPAIVDDIARDNPFHAIYISMQGVEKGAYERSMRGRLDFDETMRNVDYLVEKRVPRLKLVISMVKTSEIDADAAIEYWRSRGVEAKSTVLENRGGNIPEFDHLKTSEGRIFKNCSRLLKAAYITFDGDMVLCCADYYRAVVLGNVRERSIFDVWNSERATEIRRDFLRGRPNPLCAACTIDKP